MVGVINESKGLILLVPGRRSAGPVWFICIKVGFISRQGEEAIKVSLKTSADKIIRSGYALIP